MKTFTNADFDEREIIKGHLDPKDHLDMNGKYAYIVGGPLDTLESVKAEMVEYWTEDDIVWNPVGEPYLNPRTMNWETKVLHVEDKRKYDAKKAARAARGITGPTLRERLDEIERQAWMEFNAEGSA